MNQNQKVEFLGYGVLTKFFRKLHKPAIKFASLLLKQSHKFQFEQYKIMFGERDDDIYIATFPKSGTTLMQMILYQLTTDGKMDFNHIYEVSPWIRNASFKKQIPVKLPSPRLIKTHDAYDEFPRNIKGKIIFVYRNGMDTAISYYHQQKNYNKPDLQLDEYISNFIKSKSWFKFSKAWFVNKHKLPIHYVRYEDLISNKRHEIERLIKFCNLDVSEATIDRAMEYSSFEMMKKYEDKFGDRPPENNKVYDQFIRKGKSGEGKKLFNENQEKSFKELYESIVQPYEKKIFD